MWHVRVAIAGSAIANQQLVVRDSAFRNRLRIGDIMLKLTIMILLLIFINVMILFYGYDCYCLMLFDVVLRLS